MCSLCALRLVVRGLLMISFDLGVFSIWLGEFLDSSCMSRHAVVCLYILSWSALRDCMICNEMCVSFPLCLPLGAMHEVVCSCVRLDMFVFCNLEVGAYHANKTLASFANYNPIDAQP